MRNKIGGLAWIERGTEGAVSPNVGIIVECLTVDGKHSKYGIIWKVRSKGHDIITEYGGFGPEAHMPDDWLRPIPPDELPGLNLSEKYQPKVPVEA